MYESIKTRLFLVVLVVIVVGFGASKMKGAACEDTANPAVTWGKNGTMLVEEVHNEPCLTQYYSPSLFVYRDERRDNLVWVLQTRKGTIKNQIHLLRHLLPFCKCISDMDKFVFSYVNFFHSVAQNYFIVILHQFRI